MQKRKPFSGIIRYVSVALMLVSMLFASGCNSKKDIHKGDITILAAASLKQPIEEAAKLYKTTYPDVNIIVETEGSGTLQTHIEHGAECDIFIPASKKNIQELSARGYVVQYKELLENEVVLIKGKDTQTPVTGFRNCYAAQSIAIGTSGVPAGDYARQIFNNLGIMSRVYSRPVNECSNVFSVLRAVTEGANEVGVVYKTDALMMKDSVDIIDTATSDMLKSRVVYPVGIIKNASKNDVTTQVVSDFYEFLSSPEARCVFMRYGFTTIRP